MILLIEQEKSVCSSYCAADLQLCFRKDKMLVFLYDGSYVKNNGGKVSSDKSTYLTSLRDSIIFLFSSSEPKVSL